MDFGNFVKGLYDPFKDMNAKLAELAKKLKATPGDKTVLQEDQSLRPEFGTKAQLLYRAIEAAGEKGDDRVLENLGSNEKLVACLVGMLRVCVQQDDINGKLSRAVLRLMTQITTLQDKTLKSSKFARLQDRIQEKGDEEIKDLLRDMLANVKGAPAPAQQAPAKAGNKDDSNGTSSQTASAPVRSAPAPSAHAAKTPLLAAGNTLKKADAAKGARAASDSSPAKRVRDDDADLRASKKIAAGSSEGAAQPTPKPVVPKATSTTLQTPNKPWTGALPGKMRPATKPASKPDASKSLLSGKGEIGKTATTAKREAAKQDPLKPEPLKFKKAAAPKPEASQSQSKIGMLLQGIDNPKPAAAAKTPDSASETPETPEEKAKRLRKESRRKLRVSFKEGHELRQVRVFGKHPDETDDEDEDERGDARPLRGARDNRSEGVALKQGVALRERREKAADDGDEEDDGPYNLRAVDLGPIPADKAAKNYSTRGGNVEVNTDQQRLMKAREDKELMAVYRDEADIPPTPKSPPSLPADETGRSPRGNYLPATGPKTSEIHQRWMDARSHGSEGSQAAANQRAGARRMQSAKPEQPAGAPKYPPNVAKILANLAAIGDSVQARIDAEKLRQQAPQQTTPQQTAPQQTAPQQMAPQQTAPQQTASQQAARSAEVARLLYSDKVQNWKNPDPYDPAHPKTQRRYDYADPEVQRSADAVEAVAAQLKGQPYPPTQPPAYITDPARIQEWHEGVRRDKERKAREAQDEKARQEARNAQQAPVAAANGQQDYAAQWHAYIAQLARTHGPQAAADALVAYQQQQQQLAQQQYQAQQQQLAAAQPQQAASTEAQLGNILATLGAPAGQAAQVNPQQAQALLNAFLGNTQPAPAYQPQQPAAAVPNPHDPAYQTQVPQWSNAQQQQQQAPTPQAQQAGPTDYSAAGYGQRGSQQQYQDSYGTNARGPQQQQYDSYGTNNRSSQQQQQYGSYGTDNRGGGSGGGSGSNGGRAQGRNKRDSRDSDQTPAHLRGINRALIGTKPCTFFKNGTCAKGDKCTFRHE